MDIASVLGYIVLVVAVIALAIGYIRRRVGLKDTLAALVEIRNLATYAKSAMADGKLSQAERDQMIDKVCAIAKRFV